ncbi:hypothetical protein BCR33DRAFT_716373 [Rhizoclosmatium globosum]|uniref:Uncharacterized protein n=1 Tax=Rhizoclosmatium globosum TaxID=329046 RepID=A0A1Y2CFS1_9FUNG|nr:hypothetical protein BCR33DRAFT_716373 [Rhizoclosmatium globosum]|eukprot:ORY45747.1 hypothetical protein BCR33DRAFT_716373 [Rhizoclosmatium globosum]
MNSTITTEIPPGPSISLPQSMILGGLYGVTIHTFFYDKDGCEIKSFFLNLSSHFFFTTFDACFMGIVVILAHRICWAVSSFLVCTLSYSRLTGLGYNSADLISDGFATIVCISFNYQYLTKDWTTVHDELYWIQARKYSQQVTASRMSDMVDSECKAIPQLDPKHKFNHTSKEFNYKLLLFGLQNISRFT